MKRIISITLYSLLYYIGIASNLEIDGIYYILDENTQTATVTYKGNADDWMFDATGETLYTGNVIRLKYFTTISCPLIMMTRSSFLPLCNL